MRWEAYGYKSRPKLATKIAEKLGAASLLLRFETLAQLTAPELREVMIYSEDIVGTTILKINGQKYFDAAVCNKTIIPVPRQPNSNHNALPQRNNFKATYKYPNKSQHYPQQTANYPNRLPFRGHHQRGAPSGETEELTSDSEPEVTNQIQEHQLQETTSQMLTPEKRPNLSHSPLTSTDQPGARLLAFHNAWRAAPPGIYSIAKKGFHWTWKLQPPTLKYPTQIATNQNADLNLAIENLIKIRAIYQVPLQPCFLSPIFLVPKRTGGYRLIINLKQLNKFIEVPHFHMTNHVPLAAMRKHQHG